MDSKITIPYKWSFDKDSDRQTVALKKDDLLVGFVRSEKGNEKFEIVSDKGGISLFKSSSYNTGGQIVDSISAVVYKATSDVTTMLTFRALTDASNIKYAVAAIFRNAESVAFDSPGYRQGSPEQSLPANKQNGMGILLLNRYTSGPTTSPYTVTAKIESDNGSTMLTLDNIRTQSAQPATISHGGGAYSAVVAFLLATAVKGPNKPSNLSPSGTSSLPANVGSAFTISWSYSSPDTGSTQKAYQVVIKKKEDNRLFYDTGKVISGSSTFTLPEKTLQPDTEYEYTVQVWDQHDNVSQTSEVQYLKTYKAPTATALSPIGSMIEPGGTSLSPTLKWTYHDPQGLQTYAFSIEVKKGSDHSLVDDSHVLSTNSQSYEIPPGKLEAGVLYSWSVQVHSEERLQSEWTPEQYFITNTPPSAPTLTLPVDTYRTDIKPIFEAIAGSDPEDDRQGFVIEIAEDDQFTHDTRVYNSKANYKNWSYYDGHEWKPFDDYTVSNDTVKGKKIRFNMIEEIPLVRNRTMYWRMAGVDGTTGATGNWSKTQSIRVGNVLQFQLKEPILDKVEAQRLVMNAVYKIAEDGATPSRLLVEVSNNAADESPTWEDMTQAFVNRDYLELQNRVKQAEKWGLNVRITVFANDSLDPIEFDAFGFSFD
ncbi:hypothetical protein JNUCC42_13140 [Brevibacterium sp. JNUCC-42]|nr:hypothetical protein JNUCC42_13140 [Brevibacterium sp. JNUCC-42]